MGAKGVGYAFVTAIRQRTGDRGAYPTCQDDTAFGYVRATILQARLAERPSPTDGRDPHTGPANGQLCLARAVGLCQQKQFHRYHRVLSHASWSSVKASRVVLGLLWW